MHKINRIAKKNWLYPTLLKCNSIHRQSMDAGSQNIEGFLASFQEIYNP